MNELEKKKTNNWTLMLGFGMIGAGLLVWFFLARELFNTYNDFGSNGFVTKLSEILSGQKLFMIDELTSLSIGEGGARLFALFALFLLAWTGVSLASGLIKNGAQLLSPAFQSDIESIKIRLNRVLLSIKA